MRPRTQPGPTLDDLRNASNELHLTRLRTQLAELEADLNRTWRGRTLMRLGRLWIGLSRAFGKR